MAGRAIVAGFLVGNPVGGHVLSILHWLVGLRSLGWDVLFVDHSPSGRYRAEGSRVGPMLGVIAGLVLAAAAGYAFGPLCGLVDEDGARAGGFVFCAVWMGAIVSGAVMRDLALTAPSSRLGRGALLNRMVPAVYAAPVLFHYLNTFA